MAYSELSSGGGALLPTRRSGGSGGGVARMLLCRPATRGGAALALLAGLLASTMLFNSLRQHTILVSALQHQRYENFGLGPAAGEPPEQRARQWGEVWAAARAAGSEGEFLQAMAGLSARHAAEGAEPGGRTGATGPSGGGGGAAPEPAPAAAAAARPLPPAPRLGPLSAALARASACADGSLVVAVAGAEHSDFVINWAASLDAAGLCYLVGAWDERLGADLEGRGIPVFALPHPSGEPPPGADADAAAWRDMQRPARRRAGVARALASYPGLSLVALSDCDGVWLGDGFEAARRAPEADVLVGGAHLTPGTAVNDTGLEEPTARVAGALDTGLLIFRPSRRVRAFFDAWSAALEAGAAAVESAAFGDVALAGWDPPPARPAPSLSLVAPPRPPPAAVAVAAAAGAGARAGEAAAAGPAAAGPGGEGGGRAGGGGEEGPDGGIAAALLAHAIEQAKELEALEAKQSRAAAPRVGLPGGGGGGAGAGGGAQQQQGRRRPDAAAAISSEHRRSRALLAAAAAAQAKGAPKPAPKRRRGGVADPLSAEDDEPGAPVPMDWMEEGQGSSSGGGGGGGGAVGGGNDSSSKGGGAARAAAQAPARPAFDAAAAAAASGLPVLAPPEGSRLIAGWHGRVLLGVLPLWQFPNGHTFFVQRLQELPGAPRPLVLRSSHVFGGPAAKRHRLREAQLFADDGDYYYSRDQGGPKYVSFDLESYPDLSPGDFSHLSPGDMAKYHSKGLTLQLEQLWAGVGLAAALGRALVLPRLACFCDRGWTGTDKCRLPGADMERLPFPCPLDHVLPPERFADAASDAAVAVREAGALTNPRAPAELRRGVLRITPVEGLQLPHEAWDAPSGGVALRIPRDLQQGVLLQALAPYAHHPVWHFTTPLRVLKGFDDPRAAAAVQRRIDHLRLALP
ncbi:hypothetical protein Rsub_09576 [Raphidocelis subcapitata]|uniref:Uncharacterized protein n=1 Tax=Raphidocelis subcapitata TaxID=307507 RepID=A0A2V0PHM3_9CHLO|nr:hypothetical protein Rsub_09576 [Raphidocelis subcapitata]|eukprot:GBF97410.1 hypothetical protein Rsub_09576 [Raphidocelis subcapitata]